jgi:hypothetical protein
MTDSLLLLVMYVDDFLITGCLNLAIDAVKRILHDRFLMMDMGPLRVNIMVAAGGIYPHV